MAERAEVNELAGELVKESSPIGRWCGQKERSGIEVEEMAAVGDFIFGVAVGEEAKVADTDEACGQDVEEEAPKELDGSEGECFFDGTVAVIFPAEADATVLDLQQAVVGDGNAMGVASEIVDDLSGAAEGLLGVDNPAAVGGGAQPAAESFRVGEGGEIAKEAELTVLEGLEQSVTKEMAEAGAEDFDGEEEGFALFRAGTGDPALAIEGESAARDNTMQVGVMGQLLAPSVEDGEETELSA